MTEDWAWARSRNFNRKTKQWDDPDTVASAYQYAESLGVLDAVKNKGPEILYAIQRAKNQAQARRRLKQQQAHSWALTWLMMVSAFVMVTLWTEGGVGWYHHWFLGLVYLGSCNNYLRIARR